jgi:hypothetical protein
MEQALLDLESFEALFDQCRLGLCDDQGNPHKKPTKFCTSSAEFAQAFDGLRCLKDHVHRPVLGGRRITSAAGIYPRDLAKALVSGIEAQFVKEFKTLQEVLMTDDGLNLNCLESPKLITRRRRRNLFLRRINQRYLLESSWQ